MESTPPKNQKRKNSSEIISNLPKKPFKEMVEKKQRECLKQATIENFFTRKM